MRNESNDDMNTNSLNAYRRSFLVVLGNGVGHASRVVGHDVRVTHLQLEVVETDYRMFFCVVLLFLLEFIHLGLDYLAGTLVALTEVSQGSLPTIRLHSTKWGKKYMSMASPTVEWRCDSALPARSSPKVA